ncbi:lung adenoma susceptibility protein 2 isoform X2 [Thalassophryne amazonica]|uniref:lung adenoma susceptibility protein 2 isoform X2 n=1 Tax=Thalassophryne amazonica TaxID=390379 RepID=UPI0014712401|nr:lung adenoma susceptibility protein 2 isoform X2 [Thalassophryne amazonica]
MESSGPVGGALSPESTVTSLLWSSGFLSSSLQISDRNSSFRYKNKDYMSASEALDAYIADFEESHLVRKPSAGRLVLPVDPLSTVATPTESVLRNKDVLRECLTDSELNFMDLPVSLLHYRGNQDRLSMTTDELLSIPNDGSMPITHTSAFLQGLLAQSSSTSRPEHTLSDWLRSQALTQVTSGPWRSSRSRARPGATMMKADSPRSSVNRFKAAFSPAGMESAEPSSMCPCEKPVKDCSVGSCVHRYQDCIHRCDTTHLPESWSNHGDLPPAASRTGVPSWVAELENGGGPDPTAADVVEQVHIHVDCQQTLRDLRLQFAEQLSLLATDHTCHSNIKSRGGSAEDLLLSPSISLDSAATTGGATDTVTCFDQAKNSPLWGNTHQPGPMEVLKQILFRLQAVEVQLEQQQHHQQQQSSASNLKPRLSEEAPERPEAENEAEFLPDQPTLHRALRQLSPPKPLLDEMRDREVDEDGGRYSSSSTDRLDVVPPTDRLKHRPATKQSTATYRTVQQH